MAIVPMLFRDWLDDLEDSLRPSLFLNKWKPTNDLTPEDILLALDRIPRPHRCKRSWRQSESECQDELDGVVSKKSNGDFQINVNVEQFEPEELSVKATGKHLTVEGKHEEKDDQDGYVLRHFVHRYQLPEGHDNEKISSTLSSDGVLTISAPKLALPGPDQKISIPVQKELHAKESTVKQKSKSKKRSHKKH
ncbi:protein lethal(2)essential for life-like [Aedes albopictus]|uniref:SHSP domain-containing protein n=1 Tax=Aedes albopictus TaxID=7160 RepID=A0ABM1ZP58_AEDAL|nr:protein lethal(2)essential for life-like [Aedes albopictus]XP_019556601.2 protein lethal(2)essential for life-like [Aedes albopictus]XP_029725078.1 protein lethal(2)essential for life-like [Aedes albopictus]